MKRIVVLLLVLLLVALSVQAQTINPYQRSLQVRKLVVVDSLRVSGTLTINGAITQTANSSITGKLVVTDSARIGNMVTINNKLIVKDSLRVGAITTINGNMVVKDSLRTGSSLTVNGKVVISDSIRAGSTATFNALLSGAQIGFSTVATKAIDSAAAAVDTLKLGSVVASRIKVRGESGAVDSITTITGLMGTATAPVIYIFSAVADDTTITFMDGTNLHLGANRVLDALGDRLVCESDGTNLYELAFISND